MKVWVRYSGTGCCVLGLAVDSLRLPEALKRLCACRRLWVLVGRTPNKAPDSWVTAVQVLRSVGWGLLFSHNAAQI